MKKKNSVFVFLAIFAVFTLINTYRSPVQPAKEATVVRAAIDIGSGSTKLRVAEVNTEEGRIVKILVDEAFTVPYQEALEQSSNSTFDEKVQKVGLAALSQAKEIADNYKAKQVVAIATAAFRKAENAGEFVAKIERETGISIYIIDQEMEGKLAFEAAQASLAGDPTKLIVWDVGGGSLQLTMKNADGTYEIYRGHEASVPFKNEIVERIQGKDSAEVTSPNPITREEMAQATERAQELGREVDSRFKEAILQADYKVAGVGSVMNYSVFPVAESDNPMPVQDLYKGMINLAGKSDEEIGGGDFANVGVSNPILIHGFMSALSIDELWIVDVNNADGAFLYQEFWQE